MDKIEKLRLLFSLAPVLKGFIAMSISGAAFPLCGVMVLRLNLVPMRYMLMHGVILGGAIAMALELPLLPITVAVNLVLVFMMIMMTGNGEGRNFGGSSASTMVLSMALASLIMHVADVPAKDTLDLLWGSPFALSKADIGALIFLSLLLLLYIILNFRNIKNLFFSKEISMSLGINVKFHNTIMVIMIAAVVAVAMKLLGAFLIDSLLILPVMCAAPILKKINRNGIKSLFIGSSVTGFFLSVAGYLIAIIMDFPPAGTIALLAGILFFIGRILK